MVGIFNLQIPLDDLKAVFAYIDTSLRCAMWYEEVTGEPLEDVTLTEQWMRAHKVARAFRADTRADRPRWDRYCDDV